MRSRREAPVPSAPSALSGFDFDFSPRLRGSAVNMLCPGKQKKPGGFYAARLLMVALRT
jgi:hypothetical protein